jgi:hypothetical protein
MHIIPDTAYNQAKQRWVCKRGLSVQENVKGFKSTDLSGFPPIESKIFLVFRTLVMDKILKLLYNLVGTLAV